jgi:hypothetical protein
MRKLDSSDMSFTNKLNDSELLEKLADLEHQQWILWSKSLALSDETLSQERFDRWRRLWRTRYSDLSEEMKEQDRVWARKVLKIIHLYMQIEKDDQPWENSNSSNDRENETPRQSQEGEQERKRRRSCFDVTEEERRIGTATKTWF